jgi:hypothetical protein
MRNKGGQGDGRCSKIFRTVAIHVSLSSFNSDYDSRIFFLFGAGGTGATLV